MDQWPFGGSYSLASQGYSSSEEAMVESVVCLEIYFGYQQLGEVLCSHFNFRKQCHVQEDVKTDLEFQTSE